jgi:hypothetical protein
LAKLIINQKEKGRIDSKVFKGFKSALAELKASLEAEAEKPAKKAAAKKAAKKEDAE